MSTVGSSDSSNSANRQDEVVRRNRDEAKRSESELVKKQVKELRRVNEDHYAEVERLKQEHKAQMDDLRQSSHAEISERDHKYQQDMEELRDLYRKQLQGQADESQRREETQKKANAGDLESLKTQSDERSHRLTDDYIRGLKERELKYEGDLKENREAQRNAIDDNHDRLGRIYDTNLDAVKQERNEKVSGLQKGYDDYRQSAEARLRDQDLRHFQDQQKSSKNLLRAVQKERLGAQDAQQELREGFQDATQSIRDRFEKAASEQREVGNLSREDLRATVSDRFNNRIDRLEQANEDLKDVKTREELKSKSQTKREIANIRDAYQKNMDAYREERDQAIRQSNDITHHDVEKVRGDLEKQAIESNRFYRTLQDEQNKIHRSAYDNLKSDFEIRHEQQQDTADHRVKTIYENAQEEKARLMEFQAENHSAAQRTKQDEMRNLRSSMDEDRQIAVENLKAHLQKQEVQHSEKMTQVVSKYEKQIQALKDQMMREKKTSDENLKRVTEELQRAHKLGMDQVESQSRERLRQANEIHNEEIRNLNKRNEEKMDQVIGEIKRS